MLESGLSTIVVCLPALRYFVLQIPDALRDMLSLTTLTLHMGRRNDRVVDDASTSSHARIANITAIPIFGADTYVMNDLELQRMHV